MKVTQIDCLNDCRHNRYCVQRLGNQWVYTSLVNKISEFRSGT